MSSSSGKKLSDRDLKDMGNEFFAERNFDAAIDCYSRAIAKNPGVPHYYTNRALCFLNLKRWNSAIQDSKQALEKDSNLVKGHFYLGKDNVFNMSNNNLLYCSYLVFQARPCWKGISWMRP